MPRWLRYAHRFSPIYSSIAAEPRFLVANHNYRERPVQLYWFDTDAMQKLVQRNDALLVTAYSDNNNQESGQDDSDSSSPLLLRPVRPTLDTLQEFKVSPAIHAAYAFTWFSLSLAGLIMTRRLASASSASAVVASSGTSSASTAAAAAAAAAGLRGR
jgi:cytochrome oxidase assembly protein ShyY1